VDPTLKAFLSSWSYDLWIIVPLALATGTYVRGWMRLRRRGVARFGRRQLWTFFAAVAGLLLALMSPIDAFSPLLLQMHMIQHLLLMLVVPPVIWLSEPQMPLLFGLPISVRRFWIRPFYRSASVRVVFGWLVNPLVAWCVFVATTWIWHAPPLYQAALSSNAWHNLEHACFFYSGLVFWWPVIQPYPSAQRYSRWLILPYLFLAAVQGSILSGVFSFADRVYYPQYAMVPRLWGVTALNDQAYAGGLMWIVGMLCYLISAACIAVQLVFRDQANRSVGLVAAGPSLGLRGLVAVDASTDARVSASVVLPDWARPTADHPPAASVSDSGDRPARSSGLDLLRMRVVGMLVGGKRSRLVLQSLLLALALIVILDGLFGPQISPLNLAGVLPWIHWRGFLVLGLLLVGNLFCMACPFQLPRRLGKRWLGGRVAWPKRLRSKWLALGLLLLFFWAYEAFSLWQSPWWTAWIAVAYFLSAFVVDGFFRGAAYCKYVCPIGQFNFVQSLMSPFEVRVREPVVCSTCTSRECIRGTDRTRLGPVLSGCEMHLFQPHKSSNMDCTMCLDCVHACPHENLGLLAVIPGSELFHDPRRSGLGQFGQRPDLAALVLLLVFAAFVNAAGMIGPVLELETALNARLGLSSRLPLVTAGCCLGLLLLPTALVTVAADASRRLSRDRQRRLVIATRFSYMLIPIGFAMWLAHYSFHLFTGFESVKPALGRMMYIVGIGSDETLNWTCNCDPAGNGLLKLEILMLDAGLLMSLYIGYRMARNRFTDVRRALGAFVPWACLSLLLFAAGVWILLQPMQMRGAVQIGM